MKKILVGAFLLLSSSALGVSFGNHLEPYGASHSHFGYTHIPNPIWNQQYQKTNEDREILTNVENLLREKTCTQLSRYEEKLSKVMFDLESKGIYGGRMILLEDKGELIGVSGNYLFQKDGYRSEKIDQSSEDHLSEDPTLYYYNIYDSQIEYVLYKVYQLILEAGGNIMDTLYSDISSDKLNMMINLGFDDKELEACAIMKFPRTGRMMARSYELAVLAE